MPSPTPEAPLSVANTAANTAALSRVLEALQRADYTQRGLSELVGAPGWQAVLDTLDPVHFLLRRRDDDPRGTLARVFLTEVDVEVEAFLRAIDPRRLALARVGPAARGRSSPR